MEGFYNEKKYIKNMGNKQFKKIDKKGREETWEWNETPEVVEALKRLHVPVEERSESFKNDKTT